MGSYNAPVVSPLDPSVPNLESETPELENVLQYVIDSVLQQLNVCMPARVHAVRGNQTVDLQLLPQTLYITATEPVDKPIVVNVPVCAPAGANWSVKFPIAEGDLGLALFADRNLDAYLAGDGSSTHDPADTRTHAFADAIFMPGLPTSSQQTQDDTTDLVVVNGSTQFRLRDDGKIQVKNASQELLDVIDQLVQNQLDLLNVMQTQTFVLTEMGAQPFVAVTQAALQQVQSSLQTIKQDFETLYAPPEG